MQQLEADGWIDSKQKLTDSGHLYARILKDYKNSSAHIQIQELRIALLKDFRICAYINVAESAIQMFYIDRLSIARIVQDGYLKPEGLRTSPQMQLNLKKYQNANIIANHNFYGKDNKIYMQDKITNQESETDEITVYEWIKNYLEIREG